MPPYIEIRNIRQNNEKHRLHTCDQPFFHQAVCGKIIMRQETYLIQMTIDIDENGCVIRNAYDDGDNENDDDDIMEMKFLLK